MEIRKYQLIDLKNPKICNKLQNEVKKINGVFNASIDKQSRIMIVEVSVDDEEKNQYFKELYDKLLKAVRSCDKMIKLKRIDDIEIYRKVLYLNGLDCAYCASRVETLAKKEFNHERIVVDYPTYRFIIETTDKNLIKNIETRVSEVAHKVDERITVQAADKDKPVEFEVASQYKKSSIVLIFIGIFLFIVGPIFMYDSSLFAFDLKAIFEGISSKDSSPADSPHGYIGVIIEVIGYLLIGHRILFRFFKNIFKGRFLDENFLMSLASIGAVITQNFVEAAAIMLLYQLGEFLQNLAVNRSRKSIANLLRYDAQTVKLKLGNNVSEVGVEGLLKDDVIIIGKGEMVPVDGILAKGKTVLDTKNITGESRLRNVNAGDEIISGSINVGTMIEIRVKNTYNNSMMTRILDLVENATINKSKAENFITRFSRWYTPTVVAIAGLILSIGIPLSFFFNTFEWYQVAYAVMDFLVVACPCALIISVPLTYFCAIGLASKRGILIRGSNYLEAMSNVENIVFDKTGTLTKGDFTIINVYACEGYNKESVLRSFLYTEYYSDHPIGKSIVDNYGREKIFTEIINDFQALRGGARAEINGSKYLAANVKLAKKEKMNFVQVNNPNLIIYMFKEKNYIGYIEIGDQIREEAYEAIVNLRKNGVEKVYMLTGDSKLIADNVANKLQIDECMSELLPDEKVNQMDEIKKRHLRKNGTAVYVGDGINDAPVIAASDVGIAMGDTASDATISIADIVIMTNDLNKISELSLLAKRTKAIVIGNIIFILTVKFIVMILAMLSLFDGSGSITNLSLWLAIFSDVGVCLVAILNSLSVLAVLGKQNKVVTSIEEGDNNE